MRPPKLTRRGPKDMRACDRIVAAMGRQNQRPINPIGSDLRYFLVRVVCGDGTGNLQIRMRVAAANLAPSSAGLTVPPNEKMGNARA